MMFAGKVSIIATMVGVGSNLDITCSFISGSKTFCTL